MVAPKFPAELHDGGRPGIEADVALMVCEPGQHAMVLVGRHLVADGLQRFRHHAADDAAELSEPGPVRFRESCDVGVDGSGHGIRDW